MREKILKYFNFKNKAFTLVELSIALVVISVLIVSTFVAKEVLYRAKAVKVANELRYINTAISQFQDIYQYFPGDFPFATKTFNVEEGKIKILDGNGDGYIFGTKDTDYELTQIFAHLSASEILKDNFTGLSAKNDNINHNKWYQNLFNTEEANAETTSTVTTDCPVIEQSVPCAEGQISAIPYFTGDLITISKVYNQEDCKSDLQNVSYATESYEDNLEKPIYQPLIQPSGDSIVSFKECSIFNAQFDTTKYNILNPSELCTNNEKVEVTFYGFNKDTSVFVKAQDNCPNEMPFSNLSMFSNANDYQKNSENTLYCTNTSGRNYIVNKTEVCPTGSIETQNAVIGYMPLKSNNIIAYPNLLSFKDNKWGEMYFIKDEDKSKYKFCTFNIDKCTTTVNYNDLQNVNNIYKVCHKFNQWNVDKTNIFYSCCNRNSIAYEKQKIYNCYKKNIGTSKYRCLDKSCVNNYANSDIVGNSDNLVLFNNKNQCPCEEWSIDNSQIVQQETKCNPGEELDPLMSYIDIDNAPEECDANLNDSIPTNCTSDEFYEKRVNSISDDSNLQVTYQYGLDSGVCLINVPNELAQLLSNFSCPTGYQKYTSSNNVYKNQPTIILSTSECPIGSISDDMIYDAPPFTLGSGPTSTSSFDTTNMALISENESCPNGFVETSLKTISLNVLSVLTTAIGTGDCSKNYCSRLKNFVGSDKIKVVQGNYVRYSFNTVTKIATQNSLLSFSAPENYKFCMNLQYILTNGINSDILFNKTNKYKYCYNNSDIYTGGAARCCKTDYNITSNNYIANSKPKLKYRCCKKVIKKLVYNCKNKVCSKYMTSCNDMVKDNITLKPGYNIPKISGESKNAGTSVFAINAFNSSVVNKDILGTSYNNMILYANYDRQHTTRKHGDGALKAVEARILDSKFDDGNPKTGLITAYNVPDKTGECHNGGSDYNQNLKVYTKDWFQNTEYNKDLLQNQSCIVGRYINPKPQNVEQQ